MLNGVDGVGSTTGQSQFCAWRGGKSLTEDEYRSYLALACRLENLGVFLGAGASKCAGGKMMLDVWQDYLSRFPESVKWLTEHKFISIEEHNNPNSMNIESKIDLIQIAEQEWERQNPGDPDLVDLRKHKFNLYSTIISAAMLETSLWSNPWDVAESDALKHHKRLLTRLVCSRQPGQPAPWIFTSNYDLAIEWACEALGLDFINGFVGLHQRTFSPGCFDLSYRNLLGKGEAQFGTYHVYLVKLHGSLTWWARDSMAPLELTAKALSSVFEEIINGTSTQWPNVLIMPSSAKYMQTTTFVLAELIRRLADFVARPHTCLIINGYSFRDEHLNRILKRALNNPTLQLFIYVPDLMSSNEPHCTNSFLKSLIETEDPRVTLVGSGIRAYFEYFVSDMPQPALSIADDDQFSKVYRALRQNAHQKPMDIDGAGLHKEVSSVS